MQSNSINGQPDIANITVVTDERQVIVPQAITSVVEVNNPGPRGPAGPAGPQGPPGPILLIYRHDFNVYDYIGKAPSGSLEADNVWDITRLTIASSGSVTVGTATNVNWTGRYTHTYS